MHPAERLARQIRQRCLRNLKAYHLSEHNQNTQDARIPNRWIEIGPVMSWSYHESGTYGFWIQEEERRDPYKDNKGEWHYTTNTNTHWVGKVLVTPKLDVVYDPDDDNAPPFDKIRCALEPPR